MPDQVGKEGRCPVKPGMTGGVPGMTGGAVIAGLTGNLLKTERKPTQKGRFFIGNDICVYILPLVLLLPKTRIRCTEIITNMPFLMTAYPTFDYFSTKRSLGDIGPCEMTGGAVIADCDRRSEGMPGQAGHDEKKGRA